MILIQLGGSLAAAWLYRHPGDQGEVTPVMSKIENANVSNPLKNTAVITQVETSTIRPTRVTTPVVPTSHIVHADISFEVWQKGLPEEGKAHLTARANMLKQHEDYGVFVQSYPDQQWLEQAI